MKKSSNTPEGYFSFNTPTGSRIAKGETSEASTQPVFNDFACVPESEKAKKQEDDTPKGEANYF